MQRSQVKIAILAIVLTAAATSRAAGPVAAVSGVVRDAQGVAQMGALVQVLANDAMVGTAFTDLHGRYLIANLVPGKYEVRASAALFVPTLRENLQLRPGSKAIVNLTLNAIFDAASWLPAERRKADEPSDDWTWTLRSAANRPILRMVEDGQMIMVSSSAESRTPPDRVHASMTSGDGGFGTGGIHNVFALDRSLADRAGMTLRADMGTASGSALRAPSTDVQAGYQRRLGFAGAARTIVSYQAHPEIIGSGGVAGVQAMQLASAQKTQLGDMVELEVGSAVYVIHTANSAFAGRPFLRVTAHPTSTWTVGYRMATSRDLQSYAGLDSVQMELPVAVMSGGRMQTESGLHQEIVVGRKFGKGLAQVSFYRDKLDRIAVAGSGVLSPADFAASNGPGSTSGILADTTTDTFRLMGAGYKTRGLSVLLTEPITPAMWVALEYSNGAALTGGDGAAMTLPGVATDLKPMVSQSLTVAVRGKVLHTGTRVRAAYRWQPERFVTAVNPYEAFGDQAYLSFYLRQPVRCGSLLPPGLEATVDVTNLLEQGYRPFLSADGQTVFLAQSPRTIQAGLAFSF